MKTLISIALISFMLFTLQSLVAHENKEGICEIKRGTVKWFNVSRGYGFIAQEIGEDLFVHYRDIIIEGFIALKAGQKVEYCIFDGPKGLQAINVKVIIESNLVCKNNVTRTKGTVKMFDVSNGYGFISRADSTNVLVVFADILTKKNETLKYGDTVTFCVLETPQGEIAIKVIKEN